MSRPLARTLGALALAAALATSSTTAFAATTYGDPTFYLTKKKTTTTLAGLNPELRASALQQARSRLTAPQIKGTGGTSQSGPTDADLDHACGSDWFITWDEDAAGHPILGTFNLHCIGGPVPIG